MEQVLLAVLRVPLHYVADGEGGGVLLAFLMGRRHVLLAGVVRAGHTLIYKSPYHVGAAGRSDLNRLHRGRQFHNKFLLLHCLLRAEHRRRESHGARGVHAGRREDPGLVVGAPSGVLAGVLRRPYLLDSLLLAGDSEELLEVYIGHL